MKKVFGKQPDLNDFSGNYVIKSIKHVNFQYAISELTSTFEIQWIFSLGGASVELWNYVKPGQITPFFQKDWG